MKDHSKFLFQLLVLFLPIMLIAQDLPSIIPPSPEAASLGKFTEVPVSHYTGLPNISVPITSYEVGSKSFSVGISYHARGLKVEEIASRVGIGWALNAGGQITRQVRHHADDGPGGYINRPNSLMDALASENNNFFTSQSARNAYLSDASSGGSQPEPDRHPDQFILQAGSLSAKFIFDYKDDSPLIQSYDDIVIAWGPKVSNNIIESFVVTDKDGFKYYFGVSKNGLRTAQNWDQNFGNYAIKSEGGYDITYDDNAYTTYNTWCLMDVESPNGELVSFVYEEQISEFFRRSYDKLIDSNHAISNAAKIMSHQYQLKEILHKGGKIEFESNDLRQDIGHFCSSKELDKINIYDHNQSLVKTFALYHSYPATVSDDNQNPTLSQMDISASKRLRLDSITEIGKNALTKPPFVFTYNSQKLPNRFSNSQDLWGYYNGKGNGHFLTYFGSGYLGADRTVDTIKSMAGMLEKIKYPTGGSTKFLYEHNKGVLGPEFDHIKFRETNPGISAHAVISNIEPQTYSNGYYSKEVTINETVGPVRVNVNLPTINGINHNETCSSPHNDCGFLIRLESINNNPNPTINFNSGIEDYYFMGGDYKLIVEPKSWLLWDPAPMSAPPFIVSLTWKEQELSQHNLLYSSGKRIKMIEFLDSGGNVVSNKEYSYLNSLGDESGVILSLPFFGSLKPAFVGTNLNVFEPGEAVPGSLFTTYQDNTIGYQVVTEYHGDITNNFGKTKYEYIVQKDTDDFLSYPITPPTDNEWLRGLVRGVTHYRRGVNETYKKIKYIENQYTYGDGYLLPLIFTPLSHRQNFEDNWILSDPPLSQPGLLYDKTRSFFRLPLINLYVPFNPDGTVSHKSTNYKIYHFTGGTLGNFRSTETLYDDNENPTLITETKTAYDYDKHYQPSMVTTVTSDGIPVIQTFTYPQSLTSSSEAEQILKCQNRVVLLETRTYRDGNNDGHPGLDEFLSATKTNYLKLTKIGYECPESGLILPGSIQTSKVTGTFDNRIEFKKYDSYGNVLQVSKADGTDITYIYGYNNTLPIAKIENATYTQISNQVDDIQIKSNSDNDRTIDALNNGIKNYQGNEGQLRSALDALRTSLPNAMVTSFTYDPLIGVTSITDSKGYTVYYEYDDLNRLTRVRDANGNVMSENKYHYLLDN